jgi:hypothetical protein
MAPPARRIRFDDSLTEFVRAVAGVIGPSAFDNGRALRDAFGRLSFLSNRKLSKAVAARLEKELSTSLGPYFASDLGLVQPGEFGFDRLWGAPTRWDRVLLSDGQPLYVDVADRRVVGQDWLTPPKDEADPEPRRMVFWSAKGGVGRSTALSVLSIYLAQMGRNVLVIDADLEAPGLGAMLLDPSSRSRYGLIDYLADGHIEPWSDDEMSDFVSPSLLTDRSAGQGIVDVAPAVGTATVRAPQNMLSKLSRSLLEDPHGEHAPVPVREQLRTFVDRITQRRPYDAVLIDARAGLSEIAAGALFALGAAPLVFGVNQAQTFEDYRFLFAHLARLPHSTDPDRDWRRRFRLVHAKADPEGHDERSFKDKLYEVLSEEFYEVEEDDEGGTNIFNFSLGDPNAPHTALSINFDFPYLRFDPVLNPRQLKRETYRAAFAEFLKTACELLNIPNDAGQTL